MEIPLCCGSLYPKTNILETSYLIMSVEWWQVSAVNRAATNDLLLAGMLYTPHNGLTLFYVGLLSENLVKKLKQVFCYQFL